MKKKLRKHFGRSNNALAGIAFTILNRRWKVDGFEFDLPWNQLSFGYRSRFLFNLYERKERELVEEFLQEDDLVLELGACIGVVSCTINRKLKKHRERHVAVEANPAMIPFLVGNGARNKAKYTSLYGVVTGDERATFEPGETISLGRVVEVPKAGGIGVPGFSMVELFDKFGEFNVLVCDIEGAEHALLKSDYEELKRFKRILIEQHDSLIGVEAANECRQMLESAGFSRRKCIGKVEAWLRS